MTNLISGTGIPGLKFHLGKLSANPHVYPALPQFGFEMLDNGRLSMSRLHKSGVVAKEFATFFNSASGFRGA